MVLVETNAPIRSSMEFREDPQSKFVARRERSPVQRLHEAVDFESARRVSAESVANTFSKPDAGFKPEPSRSTVASEPSKMA